MLSSSKQKFLLIVTILAITTIAFITALPDPIDIDLNKIGNGKRSAVFVYDPNRLVSNEQAIQMNLAKEALGDSVNLLIARTGYPETTEFIERHNARIAELLFFDENGQIYEKRFAVVEASILIDLLK